MIVQNVTGITVHLKRGKSIHFTEGEFTLNVAQTIQESEDGKIKTPIEYYIITTTPLER